MDELEIDRLKEVMLKALNDTLKLAIINQMVSIQKFQNLLLNYQQSGESFYAIEIQYLEKFGQPLNFNAICRYNNLYLNGTFNFNYDYNSFNQLNNSIVEIFDSEELTRTIRNTSQQTSIKKKRINKGDAMKIVNRHLNTKTLNSSNTNIANISKSKPTWWLNIPPKRFENDLHFILVKKSSFLWVKIPAPFYSNPREYFNMREDKNVVDIIISSEKGDDYMHDIRSKYHNFDFRKFIQHEFNF